jgi:hypothetical protein
MMQTQCSGENAYAVNVTNHVARTVSLLGEKLDGFTTTPLLYRRIVLLFVHCVTNDLQDIKLCNPSQVFFALTRQGQE